MWFFRVEIHVGFPGKHLYRYGLNEPILFTQGYSIIFPASRFGTPDMHLSSRQCQAILRYKQIYMSNCQSYEMIFSIENLDLHPSTRQCQTILRYKQIYMSNCQSYEMILYRESRLAPFYKAVSGYTQIQTYLHIQLSIL